MIDFMPEELNKIRRLKNTTLLALDALKDQQRMQLQAVMFGQFLIDLMGLAEHYRVGEDVIDSVEHSMLLEIHEEYLHSDDNLAEVLQSICEMKGLAFKI